MTERSYSLLFIIVYRGKGSKILQYASKQGVSDASCFFGKGTIPNSSLEMLGMNEVNKEIILLVVASAREDEILDKLNEKFHFDRQNHGIAFMLPLAGALKMRSGDTLSWKSGTQAAGNASGYTAVFLILDKGKAETAIQISQDAGYFGGTIIKARGAAGKMSVVLDMIVEPEKEAVLMVTQSERVCELAGLLDQKLSLSEENTGILFTAEISSTVGLFENNR